MHLLAVYIAMQPRTPVMCFYVHYEFEMENENVKALGMGGSLEGIAARITTHDPGGGRDLFSRAKFNSSVR